MLTEARKLSCTERYSYTEGWDDNTLVDVANLGLNRCYNEITQIDNPANIKEYITDVVAQQQAYPIPKEVYFAIRLVDVRYLYAGLASPWAYVTLRQGAIQDRFSYPTNIPDTYAIRDGEILLSPTPNQSLNNSLVINYQARMRSLDIRRGVVSSIATANGLVAGTSNTNPCQIETEAAHGLSTGNLVSLANLGGSVNLNGNYYTITVTGADTFTLDNIDTTDTPPYTSGGNWFLNPIQFQLSFPTGSQKDVNMQANANSVLDKIDFCCIVDRYGNPVVDAISLNSYNSTSKILTAAPDWTFSDDGIVAFTQAFLTPNPIYVTQGDFSSSHSDLDSQCEDHLIEYIVLRLLRLQSAAEPTKIQMEAEESVLRRLREAYRRYRPSVMPIVWQQRMRPMSCPFGRRGIF
jgi:hypothetical protein